jgi:hypothetical protein
MTRAFGGKALCDGEADAGGGAGDQRGAIVEVQVHGMGLAATVR